MSVKTTFQTQELDTSARKGIAMIHTVEKIWTLVVPDEYVGIAVDMPAGGLDDDSFLTACHGDATHESIATLPVPLL